MALPTLTPGHKFWLYSGGSTGASYSKVCGLTALDVTESRGVLEAEVRDCAEDADDEPIMAREPGTPDMKFTAALKYSRAAYAILRAAIITNTAAHYWRIKSTKGNEYWQGQFVGDTLGLSAPAEGSVYTTSNVSFASAGEITYSEGA